MDGYRILTIDGGGIRGVVPAIVLERLCAEPELASWLDHVDLFAGTSTGGILALALAAGLSVSTIRDLYEQRSASVFHDTLFEAAFRAGDAERAGRFLAERLARRPDHFWRTRAA